MVTADRQDIEYNLFDFYTLLIGIFKTLPKLALRTFVFMMFLVIETCLIILYVTYQYFRHIFYQNLKKLTFVGYIALCFKKI